MRYFSFNGITSDTYFLTNKIELDILPPVGFDQINVTGRHGAIPTKSRLGVRTFKVTVTLLANDENDMRAKHRAIAAWLYTETERELWFSDADSISYNAKLASTSSLEQILNDMGEATLTFVASDPFGYGADKTVNFASASTTINNTGTAPTYPVFTFTAYAAVTGFSLTNGTTGKTLTLTGSIPAATYEINMGTNSVKNKSTGARLMNQVDINSDFWAMQAGNNVVSWTHADVADLSMTFTEKFY